MQKTKSGSVLAGLTPAAVAVIGLTTPAQAITARTTTCGSTVEVCTVTLTTPTASTMIFRTRFPSVAGGTAAYYIKKGPMGATICRGSMGYNQQKSCSIGTYRGSVSFIFYKGQRVSGSIAISG